MIILKKSMQKYIIFLTWNDLLSFFLFLIKKYSVGHQFLMSSASRIPFPKIMKASTIIMIAMPGMKAW